MSCVRLGILRSRLCFEVFAGRAGISKALRKRGFGVEKPLEAFPSRGVYVPEADFWLADVYDKLEADILRGVYSYVHFGVPCRTFSALKRLSGGMCRQDLPAGDGTVSDEIDANRLVWKVVRLCRALNDGGRLFSIGDPASSMLGHLPEIVKRLLRQPQHYPSLILFMLLIIFIITCITVLV